MTNPDRSPLAEPLRFVEAIFGPLGSNAGVPVEDLTAAMERLGVSLPAALQELYRRTGQVAPLHAAHNTLVRLDQIDFGDDHLIFYEENQGAVAWGVARSRLSEPDPPVDQGQPPRAEGDPWVFCPEFASISEFVCAQAAWQAVQGGLPFVGVKQRFPHAIEVVLGAPAVELKGMRAWLLEKGVAVDTGDGSVSLGTQDAESFEVASVRLGIHVDAWDYATLQDEA
jgi:hypothetical protein